jgi:5'-nucleotidase
MPLILLTNDDGIEADGLQFLHSELKKVGDVVVAAPARQQSAVSHCISLAIPLRIKSLGQNKYAVSGTPADSAFLGMFELCERLPDLVVSGINHGANVGTDLFYSGTVAGAMEAGMRGIPAISVSQQLPETLITPLKGQTIAEKTADHWDPFEHTDDEMARCLKQTAGFAASVALALLERPLPENTVLNLNGPNRSATGYAWTRVGRRIYRGHVERRFDPRGLPYYWIGGPREAYAPEPGSDLAALQGGLFSLTLLGTDWTAAREAELRPAWSFPPLCDRTG